MADETQELLGESKRTNRLLALLLAKGVQQNEAIAMLGTAGFKPRVIAELLGTTRNTVSVALSVQKKRRTKTKNVSAKVKRN